MNDEALRIAEEALEKELAAKPRLRKYQEEIDSLLSKCTSSTDRMTAISIMIAAKAHEMAYELNRLTGLLAGAAKKGPSDD